MLATPFRMGGEVGGGGGGAPPPPPQFSGVHLEHAIGLWILRYCIQVLWLEPPLGV